MTLSTRPLSGHLGRRPGVTRTACWLALALAVVLMVAAGATAAIRGEEPTLRASAKPAFPSNVIDGRFIVLYESSVANVDAETDRQERTKGFEAKLRFRRAVKGFAARLSDGQVRRLRADPDVALVTPDRRVEALGAVPLASGESAPSGIRRMQAATATATRQASDAAVAVLDTGVDLSHPDLNVADGTDCVSPGTSAQDDQGHGTHVAGTIAAKNQGSGVVGVAPATKLYAVKVLDSSGSGTWSQVICGIDWVTANAASHNIKVANMSLGGPGSNDNNCGKTDGDPLHQAVCRSTQAGITHVVAAGNSAWDIGDAPPDTPATFPEVLTVTAMSDSDGQGGARGPAPSCRTGEADDAYASFSNYATRAGDIAHMVAAPGVCIRSTLPGGGYGTSSGTSMASPHVAGAVALCLGEAGAAGPCAAKTPAQIIQHVRGEAEAHSKADSTYGFYGDPTRPNKWGDYFGYLARADQDTTPPETSIGAGPSGPTSSTSAQFSFAASELGSSFECKLDAGAWGSCASPKSYSALSEGSHTFSVRARDAAGNTDASPATRTWTVDTQPPDTSITSGPTGPTNDATPEFAFAASESGGRFECRVDAGAWQSCFSPHTTAALNDGPHTFDVRAVDPAGNTDASPASRSLTVDTRPPAVTLKSPAGGSFTNDSTPTLSGGAGTAEGDSLTVTAKIYPGTAASGTPIQTVTAPNVSGAWSVDATTALPDGVYTAQGEQTDSATNTGTAAASTFTVDTVAPDTSITSGPSGLTSDSTPTLGFSSTEAGASFECRVDAGTWAPCSSPHTTSALSDGDHTIEVRARDRAGNLDGSPATRSMTVDTTAPDTTITVAPESPTKNATPTFEFVSNDGEASFECRVDSGSWSSCVSPHRTETLSAGEHTFAVRATDRAGNPDGTPASRTFTIDSEAVATQPPRASSQLASAVGETSATAFAIVNPNGQETTYHFEYGTTTAYGARTTDQSAGSGSTDETVSASLSGLSPGTTYHYRVMATNASGTTAGEDRTFTTTSPPPDTQITSGPEGFTSDDTPTFAFSSTGGERFQCQVDGAALTECTSPYTLPQVSEGNHTLKVRALDGTGSADPTPAERSFTVDITPPAAEPPAQSLRQGSGLGTSTVPVRLAWSATDNLASQSSLRYDLEQRTYSGGVWGPWAGLLKATSARSAVRSLAPWSRHRFRARGLDVAGNLGAFSSGPSFLVRAFQESSSAITYRGTWRSVQQASAFGGAVRYTTSSGARAALSFKGRNVGVAMPLRSTLGSARICLDPGTSRESCRNVDLSPSSGTGARKLVFARNGLDPSLTHTVVISRRGGRVELDAVAILG